MLSLAGSPSSWDAFDCVPFDILDTSLLLRWLSLFFALFAKERRRRGIGLAR